MDFHCLTHSGYDGLVNVYRDTSLLQPLAHASHPDKIVQARWHPSAPAFATSSADRTARVWTLLPEL